MDVEPLLARAADHANEWLRSLPDRPVAARASVSDLQKLLAVPVPEVAMPAEQVLDELAAGVEPGLVASPGPRYFGFVIGGSHPIALAADWLVSAWDQNACLVVTSPASAVVHDVALGWVADLLGLPQGVSSAFVTGGQMGNWVGLAAARHHVLAERGWDVERDGLQGAPPIRAIVGAERHHTVDVALQFLGLGRDNLLIVDADDNGRMRPDALRAALAGGDGDVATIVCAQAGNVNTGSIDPIGEICDVAGASGAWVHVDGAFGLWAAASPTRRAQIAGLERADSWSTDAHKWLNVPYDCGMAFCAHPESHLAATSLAAPYILESAIGRDPLAWSPEQSQRARGIPVYATIRALGRDGVAALVDRCCDLAAEFARAVHAPPNAEVLNSVDLNQVLVGFADDATAERVIDTLQASGIAWAGGSTWHGRRVLRFSVSGWNTTSADIEAAAAVILDAASTELTG